MGDILIYAIGMPTCVRMRFHGRYHLAMFELIYLCECYYIHTMPL